MRYRPMTSGEPTKYRTMWLQEINEHDGEMDSIRMRSAVRRGVR